MPAFVVGHAPASMLDIPWQIQPVRAASLHRAGMAVLPMPGPKDGVRLLITWINLYTYAMPIRTEGRFVTLKTRGVTNLPVVNVARPLARRSPVVALSRSHDRA